MRRFCHLTSAKLTIWVNPKPFNEKPSFFITHLHPITATPFNKTRLSVMSADALTVFFTVTHCSFFFPPHREERAGLQRTCFLEDTHQTHVPVCRVETQADY